MWHPPSNSDHQDYYIFSRGFLSTFICHCYWEGATPNGYIFGTEWNSPSVWKSNIEKMVPTIGSQIEVNENSVLGVYSVPSLKLTWPLKIDLPNRKVVFQPSIFRGYVSFREGKSAANFFGETWSFWNHPYMLAILRCILRSGIDDFIKQVENYPLLGLNDCDSRSLLPW